MFLKSTTLWLLGNQWPLWLALWLLKSLLVIGLWIDFIVYYSSLQRLPHFSYFWQLASRNQSCEFKTQELNRLLLKNINLLVVPVSRFATIRLISHRSRANTLLISTHRRFRAVGKSRTSWFGTVVDWRGRVLSVRRIDSWNTDEKSCTGHYMEPLVFAKNQEQSLLFKYQVSPSSILVLYTEWASPSTRP